MPYDLDAEIAAYALTDEARRIEAEAQELVNYYHKLVLSETPEEDPFADIFCDGARLPDWDERHVYTCPVGRVGLGADCPTRADLPEHADEEDIKRYNRRVLKHLNVHAAGTRFVPPPYFYDKDGKRISR